MPLFLFSDIESSTRLWEKYPEDMKLALRSHDEILERCLDAEGGRIIKHTGDGVFAVFEDPRGGAACALAIQSALARNDWGPVGELRIRLALHFGDAALRGDDYFGPAVNRAARIMSAGWGGQILMSDAALKECLLPPGAESRDLGLHLLKDLREPARIYQLDHPDLPRRTYPELRSLSARPNNLPAQATPFVGRTRELRELRRMLQAQEPLLTLLGPGGMGKTRLALEIARENIEHFYHGVYFVSLAPLESAERLVYAMADSLRFSFYSNDEPELQLRNYLREKEMLIVLDNFEHIIQGAELVGAILDHAPAVRLLVTSRETLKLRRERVFAVSGMSFPDNQAPDLEADGYSSVELFTAAAKRVRPDFDGESEIKHIHDICKLVGGMPLAIELAGAWCASLECEDIVQELKRDGDFLETSMRDVPERHRSLRAVFEYSWNLLTEQERESLARLSVFRGDFTREAAAGALNVSLPILTTLLHKSLLQKTAGGRFAVHNMLARYAGEMLAPDEAQALREKHSAYFSAFMRGGEPFMWRLPTDAKIQAEVKVELENLRAGFLEAGRNGRWELVGGYMRSMNGAFEGSDRHREGEKVVGMVLEGLAKFPAESESEKLALVFLRSMHAWLGLRFGGLDEKRKQLVEIRGLVRDARVEERVLVDGVLSYIEYLSGNYEAAVDVGEQARELADELELPWACSYTRAHLAYIYFIRSDYEKARAYATRALELTREQGQKVGAAYNLNNLAEIEKAEGNLALAEEYLEESLHFFEEAELKSGIGFVLNNLAELDIKLGRQTLAWERYERSLVIAQDLGFDWGMGTALTGLGELALALEDFGEADEKFRESLAYFNRLGDSFRLARAHRKRGEAALALEDPAGAREQFRRALEIALEAGIPAEISAGMVPLISLVHRRNNPAQGLQALSAVLAQASVAGDTAAAARDLREELQKELNEKPTAAAGSAGDPPDLIAAARALLAASR